MHRTDNNMIGDTDTGAVRGHRFFLLVNHMGTYYLGRDPVSIANVSELFAC